MRSVPIALVILDSGFGGGHQHVLDLAANLSKRFDPVVISSSQEMIKKAKKLKLAAVTLPASRFFGIEDIQPLREFVIKRKLSLIHAHGPRAGGATALATRRLGVPFVYTDHAWNPDYTIQPFNSAIQLAGLKLVCRLAKKVIVVSQKSREFLVGRGIAKPEKTVVVPNGIDLRLFRPRRATMDDKSILAGSVGVFNKRKAHDVFVAAMPYVLAKNPKIRFTIIGDGPEKLNVEKLAIELGVRRFIHFAGRLSDQERDVERRKWTVYVQSSRDESFGIAAAEALAMGIPVVATDVGGLTEVVNGGGLLVEKENPPALAKAILKLLENRRLREKLAKRGSVHVRKNYDLRKIVQQVERLYDSVL